MSALWRSLTASGPSDPTTFWRGRARDPGWLSVMWRNPHYNELAHRDQWRAIERNLPARRDAVLDLGCGTGRLSVDLARLFGRYVGADLDTMVAEARRRHPDLPPSAEFVAATVQEYDFPEATFDLILSMACLSSACRAGDFPETAARIARSLRPGGRVIMIDPFHRLSLLRRTCQLSPREVIAIHEGSGLRLVEWGGVHFIPSRFVLARGLMARWRSLTRLGYGMGEAFLRVPGMRRPFSDYRVIALERPD